MKFIARIQQEELVDKTLPYPYFIDKDGLVGRQDFWKGRPFRLLGFHDRPKAGDIKLLFEEFKKDINKAIGMYPVFEYKNGDIRTHTTAVEFIEV